MRVAIITESFLPALNGVTTSVCRVADCLADAGHEAILLVPRASAWSGEQVPARFHGFPVHTFASLPVRQFRVGIPTFEIESRLREFSPDVAHVASPFVLGMGGLVACRNLGIPSVAIYQTDMPSYIRQHAGPAGRVVSNVAWRWIRAIHDQADLTLAPSSAALRDLQVNGVPRTELWGRGVDSELFHPRWRDDDEAQALKARVAPGGELVIGYVGRLAPEKELHRLSEVAGLPGTSLVIVGDGPSREQLSHQFPRAHFLGRQEGAELARCYAAFDLFVHTGTRETFGQTLQEAGASGLPVIAPAAGGPLDVIADGSTGLLFDPDRPGALRDAVVSLLEGAQAGERRAAMGSAGRERVAARSWTALVDQLLGYYSSVLGSAAA